MEKHKKKTDVLHYLDTHHNSFIGTGECQAPCLPSKLRTIPFIFQVYISKHLFSILQTLQYQTNRTYLDCGYSRKINSQNVIPFKDLYQAFSKIFCLFFKERECEENGNGNVGRFYFSNFPKWLLYQFAYLVNLLNKSEMQRAATTIKCSISLLLLKPERDLIIETVCFALKFNHSPINSSLKENLKNVILW